MQKDANLVELEKCCQTHISLQNFVLIQPRTSPPKICKICPKKIAKFANGRALRRGLLQEEVVHALERLREERPDGPRDGRDELPDDRLELADEAWGLRK